MAWPADLPPLFKGLGYQENFPDGSYRTETDSGPGKSRPRPDAPNTQIPKVQYLTESQMESLLTFRNVALSHGALTFKEFHPRTQDTVTLGFTGDLGVTYRDRFYVASFTLEVLP